MSGQLHAPAALPPGKEPLYRLDIDHNVAKGNHFCTVCIHCILVHDTLCVVWYICTEPVPVTKHADKNADFHYFLATEPDCGIQSPATFLTENASIFQNRADFRNY
jgi:hypothetical protein